MSLKVAGRLHLLVNAWNKDLMAGAGAAMLDKEVNVGMDGMHCCGLAWVPDVVECLTSLAHRDSYKGEINFYLITAVWRFRQPNLILVATGAVTWFA